MRFRYVTLLLILLAIVGSATSCGEFQQDPSGHRGFRLRTRNVLEATTRRLLDTEVPDRFKKWSIFRDGNVIREGARKGYSGLLGLGDRIVRPYPFSKDIEKEWRYLPDLRKHYFLPRVLRVPLILQDGPIRHEKELKSFVKGDDKDFEIKDAAKKHIPTLAEEEAEEEAKKSASLQREVSPSEDPPLADLRTRRKSFRRRRRPLHRVSSFSQFQAAPEEESTLSSTLVSDDQKGKHTMDPEAGPSPHVPSSSNADGDRTFEQSSSQAATETARQTSAHRMDTTLIKMTERFEALKQFREQQTRKASIRYVGHPEYKAPELQQEAAAGKEPGAGLAPIRTKISTSRAVTPDGTPRGNGDTAGADGDISNSNTPHDFFSSHYYRDLPIRPGSHDTPEPHTPNNLPSPYVSTPGDMSPGGISTSTGAIQTPIHSERDAGFRLPANYAELVRKARLQRGLDRVQPSGWTPLASPWGSIRASPSRESMMRWNAGLPSEEGLRDLHEVSSFYHIDRAIYDHEGRKHHAPIESQFDAARPPSNKDPSSGSLSSSSSKRKASSDDPIMQSARSSRSGIVEEHALQDRTSTNLDPSTPSHTQEADANMKPPASPDIVPASQSSNPQRSVEALQLDAAEPAKKRNRPHPIQTFLQTSSNLFRFPTPKLSPISPGMDGFKPSLHVEMAASPELSPGRQTVKNAVQSLKDRMRHLSTLSSPGSTIEAFKAQRREDHRSDRLSFDPTDGPVVSAP